MTLGDLWVLGVYAGVGNIAPGLFSFLLPVVLRATGLSGSYPIWLLLLVLGTVLYYAIRRNAWYFQLVGQGSPPDEARQMARQIARQHGQKIFPAGSMIDSLLLSAKVWKTWCLVILYFTTFVVLSF